MPPSQSPWFGKSGRKRDTVLQFFKLHSRSPSPNPSSSALPQAPPPNPPSSVLPQAPPPNLPSSVLLQAPPPNSVLPQAGQAPHVPSTSGSNNLWTEAYHKLPNDLKQHLGVNKPELETLQDVLKMAIQAKEANMANKLKLKWGDKEIDVQETADRLVGWIARFKEIGDIVMQYDPVHAALPWAGVRFILLVRSTIYFIDN